MPRYIDSEILWQKLHEVGGCGAEKGTWAAGWDQAIDEAIMLLDKMPTADVVPRAESMAEIERLEKELNYWIIETKEARRDIDQAVAEVVRVILGDIENLCDRTAFADCWSEGGFRDDLAKLKKKYTGG